LLTKFNRLLKNKKIRGIVLKIRKHILSYRLCSNRWTSILNRSCLQRIKLVNKSSLMTIKPWLIKKPSKSRNFSSKNLLKRSQNEWFSTNTSNIFYTYHNYCIYYRISSYSQISSWYLGLFGYDRLRTPYHLYK
jgi:hypothetical protein